MYQYLLPEFCLYCIFVLGTDICKRIDKPNISLGKYWFKIFSKLNIAAHEIRQLSDSKLKHFARFFLSSQVMRVQRQITFLISALSADASGSSFVEQWLFDVCCMFCSNSALKYAVQVYHWGCRMLRHLCSHSKHVSNFEQENGCCSVWKSITTDIKRC